MAGQDIERQNSALPIDDRLSSCGAADAPRALAYDPPPPTVHEEVRGSAPAASAATATRSGTMDANSDTSDAPSSGRWAATCAP